MRFPEGAACPTRPPIPHKLLEDWLRSCRPEELFDEHGGLKPELAELAPKSEWRMGANPHADLGILLRDPTGAGFPRLRGRFAHSWHARHRRHACARVLISEVSGKGSLVEREVQSRDGRRYSLRMRPDKTAENKIDGVLMALMDIDVMKRGLDQARLSLGDAVAERDLSASLLEISAR